MMMADGCTRTTSNAYCLPFFLLYQTLVKRGLLWNVVVHEIGNGWDGETTEERARADAQIGLESSLTASNKKRHTLNGPCYF
jgi:hypothetical protein